MTEPTPGPWEVTQRSEGQWGSAGQWGVAAHYLDRGGQRRRIAMCGSPRTYSNPELDAEDRANARLIAAAPDLLAALKKATHELNAIRARDGAPQHISWDRGHPIQTDACTHEYWDALTEECFAAIAKAGA